MFILCCLSLKAWVLFWVRVEFLAGFPGGSLVENLPAKAGDLGYTGSILGLERSPGAGNGNPLQYSCLGNSMDRRAWWATVHRVTESWTWLSTHALIANLKQKNSPLVSSRYPVYFPRPSLQVSTYWNHNDIVYHLAKFTPKSDFHRCQRNFDIYFLSSELHWFLFGSSLFNLH